MNNHQIASLLYSNRHTRNIFGGVYSADTVPPPSLVTEPIAYVVNKDPEGMPGSHWVAVFLAENSLCEYFDSYGLPCDLEKVNDLIGEEYIYNPVQLQSLITTVCGQHACFYILNKSRDKSMVDIIKSYPGVPLLNDNFVNQMLERHFETRLKLLDYKFLRQQSSRALEK